MLRWLPIRPPHERVPGCRVYCVRGHAERRRRRRPHRDARDARVRGWPVIIGRIQCTCTAGATPVSACSTRTAARSRRASSALPPARALCHTTVASCWLMVQCAVECNTPFTPAAVYATSAALHSNPARCSPCFNIQSSSCFTGRLRQLLHGPGEGMRRQSTRRHLSIPPRH
jgi:hypothetical protein